MKRYRWTKDVSVEGQSFRAGDEIKAGDILAGCLESCLRVGWLVEIDEPAQKKK